MKSPGKMSRNQARKAAYLGQADKGSRNQSAIDKPIIGRLVQVDTEPVFRKVEDEEALFGYRMEQVGLKPIKPFVMVVHDNIKAESSTKGIKSPNRREPNAAKRRRQQGAWSRCKHHTDPTYISGRAQCGYCGFVPPVEEANK